MAEIKEEKNQSALMENGARLILGVISAGIVFLIANFFGGFVTEAKLNQVYKPDNFVTKEIYQRDQLEYVQTKTELKGDLTVLKAGVAEVKEDTKAILKKLGR